MFKKLISLALTLSFGLQQTVFAYTASLNLSGYLNQGPNLSVSDRFRPINLRYFSYQPQTNDFKILLDKGDTKDIADTNLKISATILLDYFKIGLSLPNDKFWVNLRPDSQDEIIDEELAKTDLGKVMLEADLKLKQDTALFTSPKTPQGKEYWNKLYQKAGELFGTENITIPTLTRPWIVPGEIILRESSDNNSKASQGASTERSRSAYIYKANLKVLREEDYLTSRGGSRTAPTSDPRLKELNIYSTQLIRELILPKLTQKVNSSKDYANLRQVYFSLILARWFKETFKGRFSESSGLLKRTVPDIDSGDLTNLTSKQAWDKTTYFNAYQKSFKEGEYNLSEPVYTPTGQVIRRYMSGGIGNLLPEAEKIRNGFKGGDENIASSAITNHATRIFFTKKELNVEQFINSRERVLAIFYPIDSNLSKLTEAAKNFNEILGTNKSFLTAEETVSIDNLLRRIRENKEQVDAIKNELTEIPEGAVEPLTSLGAAWKTLNRTQVFLIDEAKNLLKIINSIQDMVDYEKWKYLNSRKDNLGAIIKDLSGQALLIKEIDSEKDTLIDSLNNLKKTTVMVDAQCLLSYVDGSSAYTSNINISIQFNKNGDILLFTKDNTPGKQLIFKIKLARDIKEIETDNYLWESKINNLSPEGAYNLVGAIKEALERANISSSPLVEDSQLAKGFKGVTFDLIEKAIEGKEKKLDGNSQWVVQFKTGINIAGVDYNVFKVSAYQQAPAGKDDKYYNKRNEVKYRTIELSANENSSEPVLQIKVYSNGDISAFASETLSDEERTIISAVAIKSFDSDSRIIMKDLFKKAGLSPEMAEAAVNNPQLGWEANIMEYGEFNEHQVKSWSRQIGPLNIINPKTKSIDISLSMIKITEDVPGLYHVIIFNPNDVDFRRESLSVTLYYKEVSSKDFGFWSGFNDLLNTDNSYQMQTDIVETVVTALGGSIGPEYIQFRDKLIKALNAAKSGSPMIDAVKKLQDQLPDDVNEQVLKFIVNVNDNGESKYPIKKDDHIMIGHVRRDRAKYFARVLQTRRFENLLGYVRFDKNFNGVSILPEEAGGEISNTFFERLFHRGYTSVRISEDEKKEHVGDNANGRNEQPFPGERRIVIAMQESSKAYVDTPAMKMKEVADAVITELDGKVDFILTNFLSSDMMKHTGNFDAAKKSNEITDQQLGRIKERIDAIKAETIKKLKSKIIDYIRVSEGMLSLLVLLDRDYDEFSKIVSSHKDSSPPNKLFYQEIKLLEQQVPLFIITADHGASEEGLKENPKESNNFHTANPVPYIIYDPLRRQKIPLKEGKTIRNNAATLLQLLGEEIPKEYDESLLPADYQGSKRRIAFAVLDGWGINPDQSYPYDAIRLADTPNYDWFVENAL